ncbi:hypothetical protein [Nocardia sp. NPDC051981]|uniref:hypothetical protein n=1 Tax=Nocardia sp. NPDC051981 TaxID=3155417 RepID=UPI00343C0311
MKNTYTISIAGPDSTTILVTATVEAFNGGARIREIRAEMGGEFTIPPELGDVDFSLLVRTSLALNLTPPAHTVPAADVPSALKVDRPSRNDSEMDDCAQYESSAASDTIGHEYSTNNHSNRLDIPADFGVTYWRLGSISKVAKHYDIPNHLAQAWIKLLQKNGQLANPWPKRGARSSR